MYLYALIAGILNVYIFFVEKPHVVNGSSYFSMLLIALLAVLIFEFLIGILIYVWEVESDFVYFLFTGFGFEYDVEDLKAYILTNIGRVILGAFCIISALYVLKLYV